MGADTISRVLRVSVLLPVYNAAPYLDAALTSLSPDLADDVEVVAVTRLGLRRG